MNRYEGMFGVLAEGIRTIEINGKTKQQIIDEICKKENCQPSDIKNFPEHIK